MQSSLKKGTTPYFKSERFSLHSQHEMQNYTWTISHSLFTGCYNREHISRLDEAEALLQNKPDSALTILQQLKSEGSQAEQAKYALLYSEALDKNHIKATNDSLIRRAWEYYKHHPKDLRRQCKTL